MAIEVGDSRTTGATALDPVEAEIVRHQVLAVVEEMAATMRKASGSPAITEANDFSVCLLDAQGEVVSFAVYITLHLGAAKECVAALLERHPVETIRPGDRFIVNDAYLGSAHLNDTGVIAPIFSPGGELLAWAWAEAHLPDYGGWGFGGFSPGITDLYQEGFRMSLVKFVEEGRTVAQVEAILRDNVRMPDLLMNDVRGLLAACNVCEDRVGQLAARHGEDRIRDVFDWSMASTEEVLRRRIASLPDGDYESEAWLEHDGVVERYYRIALVMTVAGDRLTFDFTGTDPQALGLSNGGPGAVWGFLLTPLMHQLAWDLPINHGLIRPLSVVLPSGSLVSPVPPAGVSGGHLDTGMHGVQPAVGQALTLALERAEDPALRERVSGLFHNTWMTENWFGQDGDGAPFLFFNLDGGMTGGGAQSVCDGLHTAGDLCQPDNHIPDVEWYEYLNPILFLFRRPWQDSGGPGRFRGGVGAEEAWALWGAERATGTLFGQGAEIPRSGAFGGMPAGGHAYEIWRGVDVGQKLRDGATVGDYDALREVARVDGAAAQPPGFKISNVPLSERDVVYRTLGGGSGLGDCTTRPPQLVRDDVARGLVSERAAREIYGVALERGQVDAAGTERLRSEIRARRATGTPREDAPGYGLGSARLAGCDHCRALVAGAGWRSDALAETVDAREYVERNGGWLAPARAGTVEVIEYSCPECATLLDAAVVVTRESPEPSGPS
ncbi:hydantoinase B/oxoprolinase family protein [Conexibacter sp. CPCC 206217]|uniref:hydantoinase B/oxoprolinase family protein n=1 Tax=Conexibacter sp. CPCC 206217 TaxID=3064574 RepID=UPI0027226012|nr:hydantoinase B/oxoprolinase family protein [Conexibacter sp. CPCC 206217]MDO8210105.1 hydantoinase B/oxoprolinase family protein [Conexibacter sp. CPCC 206217]